MISPEGVQVKHGRRFGMVPDYVLESKDLSLPARAVAAWLAGRSDGFQVRIGPMCRMLGLSEARWRTIRKELERIGWWQSCRCRTVDGRIVWRHEFRDTPPAATIPKKTTDGPTMDGASIHGEQKDIPGGQNQKEKTKKTTTTQNSRSTARAVVLAAKEAIERHRAQHGLAAWGDQVWQPAAALLGEVDQGLMEPVAAQWRAALMRTGQAALTKPILYLQKLVQEAKTGRFDPSGFSGFVAPRQQKQVAPPRQSDPAGFAEFLRGLNLGQGPRGGA